MILCGNRWMVMNLLLKLLRDVGLLVGNAKVCLTGLRCLLRRMGLVRG